jgi:hypothetical protein
MVLVLGIWNLVQYSCNRVVLYQIINAKHQAPGARYERRALKNPNHSSTLARHSQSFPIINHHFQLISIVAKYFLQNVQKLEKDRLAN